MTGLQLSVAILVVISACCIPSVILFDPMPPCYGTFSPTLSPTTPFFADWLVEGSVIHFTVTGFTDFSQNTDIWIALGFVEQTQAPFMFPSDVVIVSTVDMMVQDRHITGRSAPILDAESNIFNTSVTRVDSDLTMTFSRQLVTTDGTDDVSLDTPRHWIWAIGSGNFNQHTLRGLSLSPISIDCPAATTSSSSILIQPSSTDSIYTTASPIVDPPAPSPTLVACMDSFQAGNSFSALWQVTNDTVSFSISARTTGWVGMGFSEDQFMPMSDIVLGGFDGPFPLITDRYALQRATPGVDTFDNLILRSAVLRSDGVTVVSFTRKLNTNDPNGEDIDLAGRCVNLLWAWGSTITRESGPSQHTSRGVHGTICFPDISQCPAAPTSNCNDGNLRVIDETDDSGRVQICENGIYNSICSEQWTDSNAEVACRELGLVPQVESAVGLSFDSSGYDISYNLYDCAGDEPGLHLCNVSLTQCSGGEAGVRCVGARECGDDQVLCLPENTCLPSSYLCDGYPDCSDLSDEARTTCVPLLESQECTPDSIRLTGGDDQYSGKVETCVDGAYTTICDYTQTIEDAVVICRQLFDRVGYPVFRSGNPALRQNDTFSFRNLVCYGDENSTDECSFDIENSESDCSLDNVFVVQCIEPEPCQDGDIRLSNARRTTVDFNSDSIGQEGIVQKCMYGMWGDICGSWSPKTAAYICQSLGYSYEGALAIDDHISSLHIFGPTSLPVFGYAEYNCDEQLQDCISKFNDAEEMAYGCGEYPSGAALMCPDRPRTGCEPGNTRFILHYSLDKGLVEVCIGNTWRPLCSNGFDDYAAQVVCANMGFEREHSYYFDDTFDNPSGDPVILDLKCIGNESNILNCVNDTIPISSGDDSSGDTDICTSFAIARCPIYHLAIIPSPSLSNSLLTFDEGREATIECQSYLTADNLAIKNATQILSFNASGTSVSYTNCEADLSLNQPHECTGIINGFTSVNMFNINILSTSGKNSNTVVRVSIVNIDVSSNTTSNDIEYFVESLLLSQFPIELDGAQEISCDSITRRPVDYEHGLQRYECIVTTYPSQSNFSYFVMQRLLIPFPEGKAHFISSQSFAFSDIGFCNFETTFTTLIDVYAWPETKIGTVAEQRCNFGVDGVFGMATRLCTGNGWDVLDLTQCVDVTTISDTGCVDGELRLVNVFERNTSASGVLEVCQGGVFGTVCSDIWNITNPRIACSQLGYPFEDASVLPASTMGLNREGSILLDGVFCEGTEKSIMDCMPNPIGSHDCSHGDDVILFCEEPSAMCSIDERFCAGERRCIPGEYVCDGCADCLSDFSDETNCPDTIVPCEEGEVRLIGGPDEFTGAVTVCLNGAVTTVCTDSFDYRDATVLCRQAGFSDRAGYQVETSRFQVDLFGLPQAYGGLQCTGTEDNIAECSVCTATPQTGTPGVLCCSNSNRVNADEYDAVAISCLVSPSCSDGDVRLVGGTNQFEGIVELCVGGRYGYPCTDISSYSIDVRRSIGITVCKDIGLDPAGAIPFIGLESFAQFGSSSSPPVGNGAFCTLSSNSFEECVLPNIASEMHQCQNDQSSYGVICRDLSSTGCVEEEIRLVTQSAENEGILQICLSGEWVSICGDSLDDMDARVACSQLGFPSSNAAISGTISGYPLPNNITRALEENLNCTGDEKTLQSCLISQNENRVDSCNLARIHCPALPVVDVVPRSQDGTYEFDLLGTVNLTCITNGIYNIEVTRTDLTGTVDTVVYSYGASTADILVRSPFIGAHLYFSDAGTYNCTARHVVTGSISSSVAIQVTVTGPPQSSEFPYSRGFVRFSTQNLPRLNKYTFDGTNFDQETYNSITNLFVNEAIPDTLPGFQSAICSTIDPRPEDTNRLFDRMECSILSYPPVDNNIEIAQMAFYAAVESPSIYCRNSFAYSENGFCNYEETEASFGPFTYIWQETATGSEVMLPCAHNVLGTVRRRCSIEAKWEDPVFDRCDTLPEVIISSGDFLSVEIGRSVSLSCDVTSLSNNHTISWYKIDGNGELVPVQDLLDFTFSSGSFNQFGQLTLNPDTSFGDFRVLFSTVTDQNYDRLNLTSWNLNNGDGTVTTPESIAGTYVCQGMNEAGYREANVTLSVEVPSPQSNSSVTYIRATVLNFDFVVGVFNNREIQFSIVESFILESIAVERESIQVIRCREINNRPDNIGTRIDCSIEEFPERQSTVLVGTEVILFLDSLQILLPGSNFSSETGFCDYEQTSDPIFGNYTWNETLGGQSVSQPCANGVESDAIRTCVGFDEGWNILIDFSNCRDIIPLPEEFEFYLRLSSNFDNFTSGSADNAVNTLRIAIELTVSVTAECFIVPIPSIDLFQRVECRINGTIDSNSNPTAIEAMIVSSLLQQNFMVPNSNISNIEGFCNTETVEDPQGTIITWDESFSDSLNTLPCPFGPPSATATRTCTARLTWGSQNTENCATIVTEEFESLINSLAEVNVDNVADVNANLNGLVTRSVFVIDQSAQNAVVVSRVLTRTVEIFQLPTLTLPVAQAVTSGIVSILNDVEEWPVANIEAQSSIIIQAFESITVALVTQENFTNLTVVTEDVVLIAQRVDADTLSLTGRTFTANQFNGGALQVESMNDNNQTNQNLQDNQIATLTFPSGIDFEQLLGPDVENVGIFFVIYNQDTLFPSLGEPNEVTNNSVGSAVVGFTIAGLPFGTILPQPLLIDFRVFNPLTGGSENITNATCVFYNFTILDWDPSGCKTVFNPDNPTEVLCECTHLTNFACLVDISSRVDGGVMFTEEQTIALEVVSYVGVTLSLIGLVVTMITLLIFKNIRQRDVTKFHLQLCVSLTCMYIVFVSGIDKTDNRGGCITVGVLIHYFSLVSWMWMGAEALLMFQKLIIIFGQTTWKYLLLMSILCWTIPIVPVVIPVGIDPDFYITTYDDNSTRSGFCFISDVGVFFGAFLGPILLMIIFNTVVYVLVIRVLVKHNLQKKKHKIDKSLSAVEVVKLLLSICGIMILFGLTWIFAIFTFVSSNRDIAFALQFIFAFFNALQGFWIFFFFVLLNAEARQAWKKRFCPCASKKEAPTTSKTDISSKNKYFTGSKGKSVSTMSTSDDGMDTIKNNMYSASQRKTSMDHVIMKNPNVIMEEEEEDEAPLPVITITDPQFPEKKPSNELQKEETDKDYHLREDSLNCEARVKRHLTFNERKHEVEVVEIDFFEDDDDNLIF